MAWPCRDLEQFAEQVVARRARDPNIGVCAGAQALAGRQVDQLVLPGASGDLVGFPLGGTLDQDLLRPTDAGLVTMRRRSAQNPMESLEAVDTDGVLHELVLPIGGLGAGPGREHEGEGRVVPGLGDHLEGGLEVGLGLTGEADDDVGRDSQVVDTGPGGG